MQDKGQREFASTVVMRLHWKDRIKALFGYKIGITIYHLAKIGLNAKEGFHLEIATPKAEVRMYPPRSNRAVIPQVQERVEVPKCLDNKNP